MFSPLGGRVIEQECGSCFDKSQQQWQHPHLPPPTSSTHRPPRQATVPHSHSHPHSRLKEPPHHTPLSLCPSSRLFVTPLSQQRQRTNSFLSITWQNSSNIDSGCKLHGIWFVPVEGCWKTFSWFSVCFFPFNSKLALCGRSLPPPVPPAGLFFYNIPSLALNASLTIPSPLLSSNVLVSLISKDKLCKENKPRFSAGL